MNKWIMRGIDVSSNNAAGTGKVDFKRLVAQGYQFAIIRVGYGRSRGGSFQGYISTVFKTQMENALAAGMEVGVYWYSYATLPEEAEIEAKTCLNAIEPYRERLNFPIYFDQEYEPEILALTKEQRTALCEAFLCKVEQEGWYVGLYSSKDWLETKVDSDRLARYDTWVAQYAPENTFRGAYGMWQYGVIGSQGVKGKDYTITGLLPGANGNMDVNYAYKDYPKIIDQMRKRQNKKL